MNSRPSICDIHNQEYINNIISLKAVYAPYLKDFLREIFEDISFRKGSMENV